MSGGITPGDNVVILGIGGLGHMALQYARKMGFRVIAIGRGADIRDASLQLGAHHYIDTDTQEITTTLQEYGGVQAIISAISHPPTIAKALIALNPKGRLVVLGAGKDKLTVSAGDLIVGERAIMGSITGSAFENEKALQFSVLTSVRPQIETLPLEQANEAFQRMLTGNVKFRMVLTMQ